MYGGSIFPGRYKNKDVTVQDVFEAVGEYDANKISEKELCALEKVACPSAGSCGGQLISQYYGLCCSINWFGVYLVHLQRQPHMNPRDEYAYESIVSVMKLIEKKIKPREIVNRKSLINAARVVACKLEDQLMQRLHLPSLANEIGLNLT